MKTNFKNKSWKGTQKMSELNLSLKNLTVLPNNMEDFENLTALYLYVNKLEELPETIGNLKNLSVLDLHGNQLKELPESVKELASNLKELHLTDNPIANDKEAMDKLKSWLPNTNIVFK